MNTVRLYKYSPTAKSARKKKENYKCLIMALLSMYMKQRNKSSKIFRKQDNARKTHNLIYE